MHSVYSPCFYSNCYFSFPWGRFRFFLNFNHSNTTIAGQRDATCLFWRDGVIFMRGFMICHILIFFISPIQIATQTRLYHTSSAAPMPIKYPYYNTNIPRFILYFLCNSFFKLATGLQYILASFLY